MTKIIGFSAKKRGGKTTAARLVFGFGLQALGFGKIAMDDNGNLLVEKEDGEQEIFDPQDRRPEAVDWLSKEIWPYIKIYSFADPLKEMCINVLGLTEAQCYGTEEEKNSLTDWIWEKVPFRIEGKSGFMTAREVMQYWGTEVFRKVDPNIWVKATMRKIEKDNPQWAVLCDVRFPNEANAILNTPEGHVVRFTRKVDNDTHRSEVALDDYEKFSATVDNSEIDIHEKNANLYVALVELGWVPAEEELVENESK